MEDSEKSIPMIGAIKTAMSEMDEANNLKMKDVKDVSNGLIEVMNAYLGTNKKVYCALQKTKLKKIAEKMSTQGYDLENGETWLAYFVNILKSDLN